MFLCILAVLHLHGQCSVGGRNCCNTAATTLQAVGAQNQKVAAAILHQILSQVCCGFNIRRLVRKTQLLYNFCAALKGTKTFQFIFFVFRSHEELECFERYIEVQVHQICQLSA